MKNRATLFILSFLFTLNSYAQSYDFVKGYLIKETDTLKGFINSGKDPWNEKKFLLKRDLKSKEVKTYPSTEISGFFFEPTDEHFTRHTVEVDKKQVEIPKLDNFPDRVPKVETVFLQYLVIGVIDLYYYRDFKKHFFIESNGKIEELSYIKYSTYSNETKTVTTLEGYKKQLVSLMSDCKKHYASKLFYSIGSLTKVVTDYNSCKSDLKYTLKKEKLSLNAGLLLGITSSSFSYDGTGIGDGGNLNTASNANFSHPNSLLFGASFDLSLKKASPFMLNAELIFRPSSSFTASNNVTYAFDIRRDYYVSMKYTSLNLGFKVKVLRLKDLNISLKGNLSAGFLSNQENYQIQTFNSVSTTVNPLAYFKNNGLGYVGALEFSYKNLFVQFRYDMMSFDSDANKSVSASLRQTSNAVAIGLRLKK